MTMRLIWVRGKKLVKLSLKVFHGQLFIGVCDTKYWTNRVTGVLVVPAIHQIASKTYIPSNSLRDSDAV